MNLFFLSLFTIFAGGVFPIFLKRNFSSMKLLAVTAIAVGSTIGFADAVLKIVSENIAVYSLSSSHFYPSSINLLSLNSIKSLNLSFQIDTLSAFFLVIIFSIALMASIYSFHYMDKSEKALAIAVNYLFFSLLIISMALVVTASNMITFMLSWEMMSLTSFFLVIYNYKSNDNRRAGYLYFVFSHVGAMFILSAFGLLYAFTGDFNLIPMVSKTADLTSSLASTSLELTNSSICSLASLSNNQKILIFILAFIGFGSKAGVFPFHVWLPHAHPAAPSHISALMSGVMIKMGIYGIIRIYLLLHSSLDNLTELSINSQLAANHHLIGSIVILAGVISGILGVIYALGQHDIKRLLAYHSVENIGIILIGIGIGMVGISSNNPLMAALGFTGGLLHVLNHAIFKSLLFMGAGMVLHKTGSRSIDALGGLLKNMKITGSTFLIGSLAISGLPPFNGFVSEFFIYMGAFQGIFSGKMTFAIGKFNTETLAIISLAIIGGLALACFTKVVGVVFQGEPRTHAAENVNEKGIFMLLPMIILAGFCIAIGIFPEIPVLMTVKALNSIPMLEISKKALSSNSEVMADIAGKISGAALLFIAITLFIIMIRNGLYKNKAVTRSTTWGCGFTKPTVKMQYTGTSYAASIVDFFKPFAPLHEDQLPVKGRMAGKSHYYSRINDIAELYMDSVTLKPVVFLFDKLHWIQNGEIHLYIGYILLAIVVAMFFV
ncbi:MAG: hydrogenase [Desulfamplus sp.]|nr:hydrogenase [Desulfamplus sp.]